MAGIDPIGEAPKAEESGIRTFGSDAEGWVDARVHNGVGFVR